MFKFSVLLSFTGLVFSLMAQNNEGTCIPHNNGSAYPSVNVNLPHTVHSGTTVKIQNLNGNGVLVNQGTLSRNTLGSNITEFINYGTLFLTGNIETKVYNYGTIIVSGNLNIQNKGYILNYENATMCVSGGIIVNSESAIYNHGNFNVISNIHLNGGAYIANNGGGNISVENISVDGNSTFCNSSVGNTTVNSFITVTNGGMFGSCGGIFEYGGVVNQNSNGTFIVNSGNCTSCTTALGISLSEFSAHNTAGGNVIYWKTVNDRNIGYYLLQHSPDGFSWEIIQNEKSKEEPVNEYSYTHKEILTGTNYYRLLQIETGGNSEISDIIFINNTVKRVVGKVNLLGQPVDEYYRGVIIIQYEDGSTEKVLH